MTRWFLTLVLSVAMMAALPVVSATAALDGEMTDEQAGPVYLNAVCPSIRASDRFDRVVWRGRKTITWAELDRRLPEIKRVSRAYGRASQKSSRRLFNPPAPWPADVDALVTKLADADARFSAWLMSMGEATTGREWNRYWVRAKKVRYGTWGSQIRARLGLPPAGEGC